MRPAMPQFMLKFIPALLYLVTFVLTPSRAADEAGKRERLAVKETNTDGKLSRAELGEQFWKRAAGFDIDETLGEQELAALLAKGRRGVKEQARPGGANAAFSVKEFRASNGQTLRYSLFVPTERSDERLPLVLCLHGAGGNTAAANVLAAADMQKRHPCIVMAPACDGKSVRWVQHEYRGGDQIRAVMPELIEAVDHVVVEHKVDSTRPYITGQSMGGLGTWGLVANHPAKFAAAVPVCGTWSPADAKKMDGVALWAFHGADDRTVPASGSRDMIAALKAAKIKPVLATRNSLASGTAVGSRRTPRPNFGIGSFNNAASRNEHRAGTMTWISSVLREDRRGRKALFQAGGVVEVLLARHLHLRPDVRANADDSPGANAFDDEVGLKADLDAAAAQWRISVRPGDVEDGSA